MHCEKYEKYTRRSKLCTPCKRKEYYQQPHVRKKVRASQKLYRDRKKDEKNDL